MTGYEKVSQPYSLANGLTLPNRLVKAAMAENMAKSANGLPTAALNKVYQQWGDGGWGMILTGNVQVDERHWGSAGDVYLNTKIDPDQQLAAWKQWASACNAYKTPTLVQINHPGRQSPLGAGKRSMLCGKAVAPSPVPLRLGTGLASRAIEKLIFGTPRELTVADIEEVVAKFAATAKLSAEAGFAGVEVHAAHGYLLAQFLSTATNLRTDAYGGSAAKRAKVVVDVVKAVRAATQSINPQFTVGIKVNSVDQQSEASLADFVEQLRLIVDAGVDFVEISGGTYEKPTMMAGTTDAAAKTTKTPSARTAAREAFFLDFAQTIRKSFPNVPLLVTGGFRTRSGMEQALADGGCDLVGVGRPAALSPDLPKKTIFNSSVSDADAKLETVHVEAPWLMKALGMASSVGAGAATIFYVGKIKELAA